MAPSDGAAGLLVDTNILIYSVDPRDRAKRERATALLDRLVGARGLVLSAQCLSEFFRVATRRLPDRIHPAVARIQVGYWAQVCAVLDITVAAVEEACRCSVEHQIAIWDALLWAVARLNGVKVILSEDMPAGERLESVAYFNPLLPEFDVDSVLLQLHN